MRRARETTIPIAEALGVPPTTDPRLRERMNWDDPLAESVEDFLRDWRVASADRAYVPRSGDSSAEAASRFLAALDDLAITHPTGTAILVAHGGVTTDALRTLLGDDELRARAPALIDDGCPAARSRHFTGPTTAGRWRRSPRLTTYRTSRLTCSRDPRCATAPYRDCRIRDHASGTCGSASARPPRWDGALPAALDGLAVWGTLSTVGSAWGLTLRAVNGEPAFGRP
jgi:hypothetical protein